MDAGKPYISQVLVVEGKYDKITLGNIVNATILTTNGFGLFKNRDMRRFLLRLAKERGIVILTDSDGAGLLIRNHLLSFLPPETVRNAYIPQKPGKERRKTVPSRAKLLGVEGMDRECILNALGRAGVVGETDRPRTESITKADLYQWGLSGGPESAIRRKELQKKLDLPSNISPKSLCEVLTLLYTKKEIVQMLGQEDEAP